MTDHPSWDELVQNCFQSTDFMALATSGRKGLWVNPVFFAWDEAFSIYFISQHNCTHMDNIESDDRVSCAIYPTAQDGDVFGAYLTGHAQILTENSADWCKADDVYYGRLYPNDTDGRQKSQDGYRTDPRWHFVKITLTGLWYFDTRYFEENRVVVPESVWKTRGR